MINRNNILKNISAEGLEKRRIAMEKKEILLENEDNIAEELRIFNLIQSLIRIKLRRTLT